VTNSIVFDAFIYNQKGIMSILLHLKKSKQI